MPHRMLALAILLQLIAQYAQATMFTFQTASYTIRYGCECPEGCVSCDNAILTATDRKTGEVIHLKGRTHHSIAADGVSPGHFHGYSFQQDDLTYFIDGSSTLRITRNGNEVIFEEKAEPQR